MPRPRPESSFQLSASSFELCPCPVACILSAFICQINSQKGKPNLRFETISAGKVRTTNQPSSALPPHLPFRQVLHTKGQSLCPFLFYSFCCCSCCLPSGQWPPPQLCSAQLSSASTQFVTIPFCGLIFALLVSLSYFPFLPLSLSLTQSLTGCAFICLVAPPDLACLLFVLFVSALYLN